MAVKTRLLALAFGLLASGMWAVAGEQAPPDFSRGDMSKRVENVRRMVPAELQQELLRTRRIDRTGQTLLKRRAACTAWLNQAELDVAALAGKPDVKRCDEVFARPDVRQKLAQIQRLPAAQMQAQFLELMKQLVTQHGLTSDGLDQYRQVQAARQDIQRARRLLGRIEQQIAEHEQGGRAWVPEFQIPASSRSAALKQLEQDVEQDASEEDRGRPVQLDADKISDFLKAVVGDSAGEAKP